MSKVKIDTVYVGVYDSSVVISRVQNSSDQIIIIQEKKSKNEKGILQEYPLIGVLLVPVLISLVGIWVSHFLNKRKFDGEINNLKTQSNKNKAETEKIKKSFQPIVVGTIQGVRDKLIDKKIKALEVLAYHNSQFMEADEQFYGPDGDPILELSDYYDSMFINYSPSKFDEFKKYKNEFSYFFGEESFKVFKDLFEKIENMVVTRDSYYREEVEQDPRMENVVKSIIESFGHLSTCLRKELHLDNTYIEDFIRENQLNTNSEP
jgi:hypothetical protein